MCFLYVRYWCTECLAGLLLQYFIIQYFLYLVLVCFWWQGSKTFWKPSAHTQKVLILFHTLKQTAILWACPFKGPTMENIWCSRRKEKQERMCELTLKRERLEKYSCCHWGGEGGRGAADSIMFPIVWSLVPLPRSRMGETLINVWWKTPN